MLEIKDLSLSYQNGQKVLRDISLNVKEGECVLFTGESGSGKSSLLNTINGIATRYENCTYTGEVKINGIDIKNLELYEISRLITSVFQNPKTHFFNVDTTIELLFYLENIGISREQMEKRLSEMLMLFPIEHLLNRSIFNLSGGQKQILCIAASYIAGTKTIVLDEPSSNLDNIYTSLIAKMLKELKDKGITLIIAEHRLYYLMNIVDRVFFIKDGQIKNEYLRDEFLNISTEELFNKGLRNTKEVKLVQREIETNTNDFIVETLECVFPKTEKAIDVNNLHLKTGSIYGIVGKNGVGKSTFVKSLIGVNKGSKEIISLKGKKLSKKERLKISNLVMQDVNHQLFTDSVYGEVTLGIKNPDDEKVKEVLINLDLWRFKDRHPMSLSGGQKQRVAIASVILTDSKIICFDEPTSGMDYKNMMAISKLIKSCIDKNKIILIVSHDIEFLNETVDYIINIEDYKYENWHY